jgi:predicted acyltransferase
MIWILGGDEVIYALHRVNHSKTVTLLASQMEHRNWEGMTFYDLIFPLFVFIMGVCLVLSLGKRIATGGKMAAVKKIVVRSIALYILGIIYYGGFSGSVQDIRLLGVLQRIALCYLASGLLFTFLKTRGRLITCVLLLVGYWVVMTFVPVPGIGSANYHEGKNLANYIDSRYLPLFKWDGNHDPEGLLSTLPAIATCLLGVFAGQLIVSVKIPAQKKVLWLVGAGVVGIAIGVIWGMQFPIIKKVWTSSYVLVAGGLSSLLLALFFQAIEIWNLRRWAIPLVWIGLNPITLYIVQNIVDIHGLAERITGGFIQDRFKLYGNLWIASVALGLTLLLAYFFNRKRIYMRL